LRGREHLPRRAAAVLPPRAVHTPPAQREDGDPAHLRLAGRRLREGAHAAPALAGACRVRPVGAARAGGGAAAGAGALRRGMARPAAHLLLPRLRGPRRGGTPDLLSPLATLKAPRRRP